MPNVVSITFCSLQILSKIQEGVFPVFRISCQSFINENCHNSKTGNDIDMNLGPVGKLNKIKMATSKISGGVTSFSFFQFMTNVEQSRSRIPDAWSVKFTFSLIVTFYLSKTENIIKKSLAELSNYCFGYYFFC